MLKSILIELRNPDKECKDLLPPAKFLEHIHQEIYLPLVLKDWSRGNGWTNTIISSNLPCGLMINDRDMPVIKMVLAEYLRMLQFSMEEVHAQILALNGQCEDGFTNGDWSDGSGECCCSPDWEKTVTDEDKISQSFEKRCHASKKVCLCETLSTTSTIPHMLSTSPAKNDSTLSTVPHMLSTKNDSTLGTLPHMLSTQVATSRPQPYLST